MTIHWKVVEQYFAVAGCLFLVFAQFVILENLTILDLALSGVKGSKNLERGWLSWYLLCNEV